ncbi:asparagine synthase (glutamine-hydrolyzing) [Natribacillus halophilus]|uniref:asparagine synthase (glutamine-hydrolyzing) n=1 Tax=Natribacillus halophilus TaxID=549003 RepID=A0A1G8SPN9_9BACI|nr:asparagine synthase (glutamine-hydrolyzing) [Natribacillus halophilus]SDJ31226.1 asparagine synthase (glutamine-hydrolysing) [Natribacillus halophilus]
MCGFVGQIMNLSSYSDSANWGKEIYHRGPDDQGTYVDEYIQLGFRRLSILDVEYGQQPMSDPSGRYHLVFNGEIYNFIELRKELEESGLTFNTGSDTEVLLALYATEKEAAIHKLRGMFAFVIWDKEEKRLFAARDAFGIKPFYYNETEEGLGFASEEKSLFQPGTSTLSPQALQNYLTFQYVPGERCLLDEMEQLKPGHYMIKEPGKSPAIHQYQQLRFQPDGSKTLASSVKQTRDVLEDSVQKHMRSDVPVGAFLSGGIDSTSIVALAKKHNPDLTTFTVGFEREGYSEIDLAQETADQLGVKNIQKVITPEELIQELPNIIWHMDEPVADPAAIPNYFVAKEARKHVKVVLSGEGADELFGGYNIYREPLALKGFDYMPTFLKRGLNQLAQVFPEGMKGRSFLLRGTTPLSERYVGNAKIFDESEKKKIMMHHNKANGFTQLTERFYQEAASYDPSTQMQYIDLHTWLQGDILTVADRMTMAHSLELRVPFLDKEVFRVASTLPSHVKIARGTTKYVLRQAVKDLLPEVVINRKKLGFPVPIRHWLRDELYDWARQVIQNSPVDHLFNKQEIWKLLAQHVRQEHDHSRKLWTILVFMVWHDIYMEPSHVVDDEEAYKTNLLQNHEKHLENVPV